MPNDNFNRVVTFESVDGRDIYTVNGADGTSFIVDLPAGAPQSKAYDIINSMASEPQA